MSLRAALWIRESTRPQEDRFGPDAQRAAINRAIGHHRWASTGIEYVVTHSGLSVHDTPPWKAMLDDAGRRWDVLVIARTNRLSRRVRSQIEAVEDIHAAGAAVYFAREDILTSDQRGWKQWMDEAVAAEAYSRTLSRDVTEGNEAKFYAERRPHGRPPYGYNSDWTIDPVAAARVRALFAAYVVGNIGQEALAGEHGMDPEQVREILKNRTYTGMAGRRGEWIDGDFEAIIDTATFEQARETAQKRQRAGGPTPSTPSMLQGRLWCACGSSVRLDGRGGTGQPRVRHPNPCEAWGPRERRQARYYTEPIAAALSQMALTQAEIDRIIANRADRPSVPTPINWAAKRKALKQALMDEKIGGAEYDAQMLELRQDEALARNTTKPTISDERLREILRDFSALLKHASTQPYEADVWRNVIDRYFDRFEHTGPDSIMPVLNQTGAEAIISDTLPSQVVLACPRGPKPGSTTRIVRIVKPSVTAGTGGGDLPHRMETIA